MLQWLLIWALAWSAFAGDFRSALSDYQKGDLAGAEKKLRGEIAANPSDAMALSLLGAVLDGEKRAGEADAMHRRAALKAPRSPDVLNNFAAHLMMAGKPAEARGIYLRVVGIEKTQVNANLQLAGMAIGAKNGREALHYLDNLQENPTVLLLRMQALELSGDAKGAAVAASKAARFFESEVKSQPANFGLLYDLGLASTTAGDYERAREALEAARLQQPENPDVLYSLARAEEAARHWERATELLSHAARLAPARADVQKMLALTLTELEALDDASAAWTRYLKLVPGDEAARRERGYIAARVGRFQEGIADLEWFLARHPNDALGHFELGEAERSLDAAKAHAHFDKALAINPDYVPALTARGSLYYQEGKPETALKDLERAARLRPDDAVALDHLGQIYQALDRVPDAVRRLKRAAELAPADSKTLLHLARALADSGSEQESKAVMDRFRELGPEKKAGVPAGLVDYLALSPEQRRADYRARVEKTIREHPGDSAAQLSEMKLLMEEGRPEEAAAAARRLAALKPGTAVLADAARALLSARQYALAREILAQEAGAELEKALADYYASGAGETREAVVTREFEKALQATPDRADLYLEAAAFFAENGKITEALSLLETGAQALPKNREIPLRRGLVLELGGKPADAQRQLDEIESRWPEWYPVWAIQGLISTLRGEAEQARKALETMQALGGHLPSERRSLKDLLNWNSF